MAFQGTYVCTVCDTVTARNLLLAKKVMFQELGRSPRTLKSRTIHWLCPACVVKDADWKQEQHTSPGLVARTGNGSPNG